MRSLTVELPCLICDAALTATVTPGSPYVSALDQPDPPEVTDVTGCPHAEDMAADDEFLDAVIDAAAEADAAGFDAAMEPDDD